MRYKKAMYMRGQYVPDDFVFFWGHRCADQSNPGDACLSNFFPAKMVIDGETYSCVEQYMHARKAGLFKDEVTRQRIMDTTNPNQMKELGRQVSGYREKVWRQAAHDVVYKGVMAKFDQDEVLRKYLLSTNTCILVEASPYDKRWGIGLPATHTYATVPALWPGENWLGFILMEARDALREKYK